MAKRRIDLDNAIPTSELRSATGTLMKLADQLEPLASTFDSAVAKKLKSKPRYLALFTQLERLKAFV